MTDFNAKLRLLPSIDRLLNDSGASELITHYGREAVRDALRIVLDAAREWIRQGGSPPTPSVLLNSAIEVLGKTYQPSLRPVINATGVIIHTNLGRAPLSAAAQEAMVAVAAGYSTLEYELEAGTRGKRDHHAETLLKEITGAEAAMVVNNNAAALILVLTTLASSREVIISRGQLIEIGGGFRLPDIMTRSGAKLIEVGTTNRTYLDDFADAITPQTALLMRVHASNFKQVGFTHQPELNALAELAHKHGLFALDDLGSGALIDTAVYGMDHEPTVQEALQAGADLVAFSGDKLLGGPQAGIIAGKAALVDKLKKNPLARAVRIDKLCLAALVATLTHYKAGNALTQIPVLRMIAMTAEQCRARAEAWAADLGSEPIMSEVIAAESTVGGGSLPGATLPSYVLAIHAANADEFAARLRRQPTPIIARIADGRVLLDPRTVSPQQDADVIRALKAVMA
ncbi:MAG: L-seryl-tRNA(Sec) selenium transferase [Anaerolineae bacterium]|nr:L-seryl-tRNA(Sec) selenium transferase [Anaerolineae bacterium]